MIKKQLEELSEQYRIKATYLTETTSTNDAARSGDYREGDIILADLQSKGRGQRGNSWESKAGENLTFSVVLQPVFLDANRQFMISIAVSLAIADTLQNYGIEASVKWPNDIYVGDRKIAGILIENDICGDKLSRSIVGIGLNVNQKKFSHDLPNPTSMSLETGAEIDRGEVLKYFFSRLSIRYTSVVSDYMSSLLRDYHSRLYLFETEHRYSLPDGTSFMGIIRSVESTGTLIVEREDGTLKGYLFKEIEF